MTPRGVTVFVRRTGGTFHAATLTADGFAESATVACRVAAANHFAVEPEAIELTPTGEHTMIAHVRGAERRAARRRLALLGVALVCGTLGAVLIALAMGGAR